LLRLHKRVLAVALLVVLASAAGYCDVHAFKRIEVGDKLESFELEKFDGQPLSLADALGSKMTAVVFWAAWSPRSSEQLADMQKLYDELGGEGLTVFAVNVEHPEWNPAELDKIKAAVEGAGATYPVVLDKDLTIFNDVGVVAVPSTLLIDSTMTVTNTYTGYSTMGRDQLKEDVLKAFGKLDEVRKAYVREEGVYQPKGKAERYFHMGKMLSGKKRYSRAVKTLEKALEEDPEYADAHEALADAYEGAGEADKAAAARARAAELRSAQPAAEPGDGKEDEKEPEKNKDMNGAGASAADGAKQGTGEADKDGSASAEVDDDSPAARMQRLIEERKKKAASTAK